MTVSSTVVRNSYAGDNSTTQFTYTFPIHSTSELKVILRSSAGVETVQTLNSDFTINDTGTGGTVTFTTAPATGVSVVLLRDTNLTQDVDYIANDPFPAETHEGALDKIVLSVQELQEEIDRSIKVSRTAPINNSQITDDATARAGKLLGFANDGQSLDATIDGSQVSVNATNAANSATAAATSATNAENAKTAALAAQAAAEAALDTFDDDFLGAKSSDPSVDNDGNALTDGALYFDTTNNVMKVYDLGGTQWKQLVPTTSQQTNIDAAVSNATNINAVATNISNINTVNANATNINTLAGVSNLSTLGTNATAVVAAGNNITGINSFADRYRVSSNSPSTSLDAGDLWFDTTANKLKVYDGSSFALAGSSVNGTSQRFEYTATAGQTTFSGADSNGNSLTYDVASGTAFADIYLNGVKLTPSDFTATSGTSIVLGSGAAANDILQVTSYGTFTLSSFSASQITSGTVNNDRLPSPTLVVKGDGSSTDGSLRLNCSQNSHYTELKSAAHGSYAGNLSFTLPTSTGSNGQVLATNGSGVLSFIDATETKPTVADVSQTIAPATATTINITGTNFVSIPIVEFIKTDGSVTLANTVSFTNSTTLSVNVTLATGNYYVRVENPDGNAGRSTNNILTASTAPSFSSAAGSLGTFPGNFSGTLATIAGSSDSAITFSEVGSNLATANVTLSSAGVLATTDFGGSSTTPTTYNFSVRITDAENQQTDRAFSFTSSFGATGGAQFN
ncbi:sugar binding-tail fiber protein [uncultured Mediterranean phage uvMED]|nr:sugar binding-tail fiber protein [uncultured Mediterranean phage uvMED]BAR16113.1 tail fiber [uncultured Mediterranean phage uvMED]BAR16121.1 tail fiber [uncultured Mediterranean phage uvMED]